jgi:hypothetical protein
MSFQASRLLGSILHELVVLLQKERKTIASVDFQALVKRLPRPEPREAWDALISAADAPRGTSDTNLLVKLRNNLGFHYYATKTLGSGYEKAFLSANADPLRSRAVYMDGDSMEHTRFMFADAAIEHAIPALLGISKADAFEVLAKVATQANLALRYLLVGYLRKEAGGPTPFNPQLDT